MSTDSDYIRIACAIRYIRDHGASQPSLIDVARHVGLSEHHFQRLFTRWAGVSPKRFLQYITAERAKALLREGASVLDTAYDSGLSGPGRLHDLLVSVEAMSPGEYKERGAGLTIRYGVHPTPFGEALISLSDRGVCGLAFLGPSTEVEEVEALRNRWALSRLVESPEETGAMVRRIFRDDDQGTPIRLLVRGTNFQIRVWEALLRLPPGAAASYGAVARSSGNPRGARAVGSAIAKNTIGYLIPCHRAIRQTGEFGEYRWGSTRKAAMIGWEAARCGLDGAELR